MTAYLQPGDKIHITVPSDLGSFTRGQAELEEMVAALEKIVAAYASLGVKVFQATPVIHSGQVTVVAVVREGVGSRFPRRSAEKPKLVDVLPWQDPVETTEPPRKSHDVIRTTTLP